MYLCAHCKTKYAANHDSISSGTKCSSVTWLKVLHALLNFSSMQETCKACDISPNTYYNLRNRLVYGMQLMMDQVKLFGVISCDITFVRASYKGMDLSDIDYPEGSIYDQVDFKPRQSRQRGGRNSMDERSVNSIAVFTAIDEYDHVMARFVGIGAATASQLRECIGDNKLLIDIPSDDPSPFHNEKIREEETGKSLLVSDEEKAIIKYAADLGIPHEHHVYRRKDVQLRLAPNEHDIQNVNQLHKKLKQFLRDYNYVSSKYLPAFLVLFEFCQNTKCTDDAIVQLFQILAQPGLCENPAMINEQYTIPNYLQQWLSSENPSKRLKKNQALAYYLYKKRQDSIAAGEKNIQSVTDIANECNMSLSSVRRNYKNLESTGYGPEIMKLYSTGNPHRKQRQRKAFSKEIIALYDAYQKNRQLPRNERLGLTKFVRKINLEQHKNYNYRSIDYYFKEIEKAGIRKAENKGS